MTEQKRTGNFPRLPITETVNAFVAFLFAASAPVAIILGAGVRGDLSQADLASWIFAAFALNGALSIGMSVYFKQPLAFFWTIPGTVLVGSALQSLSLSEVIGAYILTALLLLILGLTGWVRSAMDRLPMPIVMGMVAGVFVQFGLDWIRAFQSDFILVAAMSATFVLLTAAPKLQATFPPMIAVLVVGLLILGFQGEDSFAWSGKNRVLAAPQFHWPVFSLAAALELVVPLAITVIAAQNAQGIVILRNAGHQPPVSAITTACGAASLATAFFGCVSSCLTGPSNAILVSSGKTERQWIAAVVLGGFAVVFGFFSPLITDLLLATPTAFLSTLAGLALLRTLQSSFQAAFGPVFPLGALVAFLVTLAGMPILNIGAPFWGLVFGVLASLLMEKESFAQR
ncbi:benzoate/H(+) symporter BenE family transporter [Ruegeria sp. WL0004]|uniref:Benzoate/H(+) symporter BenE family transporter n=1 Tax=Ruegeria marisflavi TaxID=2984152 RepID=A0ABT2WX47_9RHOB|nr:benzoate/H(+) symporter BenE family transporter [Ruegeria sp. WL0004]MCU9840483.1 benzoate/H(+) symporter BenE family transporter [Ruegeria sp. WL0004]